MMVALGEWDTNAHGNRLRSCRFVLLRLYSLYKESKNGTFKKELKKQKFNACSWTLSEKIPNVSKMPVTRCSRAKLEFPIKIYANTRDVWKV